jgi:hypothetical protein
MLGFASTAGAHLVKMPTLKKERQLQLARYRHTGGHAGAAPQIPYPHPPCPESGVTGGVGASTPIGTVGPGNCGGPETPPLQIVPYPGPMAYWGGWVETVPHVYLILWGWGQSGAFPLRKCTPVTLTEATDADGTNPVLPCDPDHAGKYMADFLRQIGGTQWAGVSTQYYQTNADGSQSNVTNPNDILSGIWVDDTNPNNLPSTKSSNPAGNTNLLTTLATEAQRAAEHFGVSGDALKNANFIIAQPPGYSDPESLARGYCGFHDYTDSQSPGNFYYKVPGLWQNISYTNIPYQLAINSGGTNVCGENSVNSGSAGRLDGFSIVVGHEVEETVTDPGAESIDSTGPAGSQTYEGGWYDAADANENGDKCAWVGQPVIGRNRYPTPGATGNITGNAGETFAVQSLWSNAALGGAGWCAGISSTDLPSPFNGY